MPCAEPRAGREAELLSGKEGGARKSTVPAQGPKGQGAALDILGSLFVSKLNFGLTQKSTKLTQNLPEPLGGTP